MQKVIFLVDMNAFFIACEMTRNPSLVDLPAAVAGSPEKRTGIILAANYKARADGVKTAMVIHEALKLCPKMRFVPPDHAFYKEKSEAVMTLLSRYSPLVDQNSIDEAWLDMTGSQGLFGKPQSAAKIIMEAIKTELGLWSSIGIAENKFLSKMASDMKKPLGITELWKDDLAKKLWPLKVGKMHGVGRKTAEKLNQLGIYTIGQLAKTDQTRLIKTLGKSGHTIYQHANGIDSTPLIPRRADDMKSIGREKTLSKNISDINSAKIILMEFADDIGRTARAHHKKGSTIQIILKYPDFKVITRQTTIEATFTTKEIYQAACFLLEKNWQKNRPVRLIGISLSGFDDEKSHQQISFFDDLAIPGKDDKNERLDQAMDKIRHKHGSDIITLASLVKKDS